MPSRPEGVCRQSRARPSILRKKGFRKVFNRRQQPDNRGQNHEAITEVLYFKNEKWFSPRLGGIAAPSCHAVGLAKAEALAEAGLREKIFLFQSGDNLSISWNNSL